MNLVRSKQTQIDKIRDDIYLRVWENPGYCPDEVADTFRNGLICSAMQIVGEIPKGILDTEAYCQSCILLIREFLKSPEMKKLLKKEIK